MWMLNTNTKEKELIKLDEIINTNEKYKDNVIVQNEIKQIHKAYKDYPAVDSLSLISLANRDNFYNICEILLENKLSNINDINLHYTVIRVNIKYFDLYLKYGIDINKDLSLITSFNKDNLNPNKSSMDKDYIFDKIINHPNLNINRTDIPMYHEKGSNTYLIKCAIAGNSKQFKEVLNKIDSKLINYRNNKGKSASYFAFEFGYLDSIEEILKFKPTLNYLDLSKFKFKNMYLLKKYGYLENEIFISEWNKRNDYLIDKINEIIKDITDDKLHFNISEYDSSSKEELYKRIKLINNTFHKDTLKFYEDDITKNDSISVFDGIIQQIKLEYI